MVGHEKGKPGGGAGGYHSGAGVVMFQGGGWGGNTMLVYAVVRLPWFVNISTLLFGKYRLGSGRGGWGIWMYFTEM